MANSLQEIINRRNFSSYNSITRHSSRSEFIRVRRIHTGLTLIQKLYRRKYRNYANDLKINFFGRYKQGNPWFKESIKRLTVSAPLNFQSVFWRMRYINQTAKSEAAKKGNLGTIQALRKLTNIVNRRRLTQVGMSYYRISACGAGEEFFMAKNQRSASFSGNGAGSGYGRGGARGGSGSVSYRNGGRGGSGNGRNGGVYGSGGSGGGGGGGSGGYGKSSGNSSSSNYYTSTQSFKGGSSSGRANGGSGSTTTTTKFGNSSSNNNNNNSTKNSRTTRTTSNNYTSSTSSNNRNLASTNNRNSASSNNRNSASNNNQNGGNYSESYTTTTTSYSSKNNQQRGSKNTRNGRNGQGNMSSGYGASGSGNGYTVVGGVSYSSGGGSGQFRTGSSNGGTQFMKNGQGMNMVSSSSSSVRMSKKEVLKK